MSGHPLAFRAYVEHRLALFPVGPEFSQRERWDGLETALEHAPGLDHVGTEVPGDAIESDSCKILNQIVHCLHSAIVHNEVELTIVGEKRPGPGRECPAGGDVDRSRYGAAAEGRGLPGVHHDSLSGEDKAKKVHPPPGWAG